jgi:TPR repeat protein
MRKTIFISILFMITACSPSYEDALNAKKQGDFKNAIKIFEDLAENDHLPSILALIDWYQVSEPPKAFIWRQEAARLGDAVNQSYVGWAHDGGTGIPDNAKLPHLAFSYYQRSAEQGEPLGEFYLGYAYERGYGVDKNEAKALEWYKKAADKGEPNALYLLGSGYYYGHLGLSVSHKTAVGLLCKASQSGNEKSAPLLKLMWVNEILIPAYNKALDYAEAPQGVKGVYSYPGEKKRLMQQARAKLAKVKKAKLSSDEQVIKQVCKP